MKHHAMKHRAMTRHAMTRHFDAVDLLGLLSMIAVGYVLLAVGSLP